MREADRPRGVGDRAPALARPDGVEPLRHPRSGREHGGRDRGRRAPASGSGIGRFARSVPAGREPRRPPPSGRWIRESGPIAWATCRLQANGTGWVPRFVSRWRKRTSRPSRRSVIHFSIRHGNATVWRLRCDGRRLAVVLLDRPVPRAVPEVAVIVERVAVELARRVGGEELVPAAAPDVVERRAGVGSPERHAGVLPEEVDARRPMHEVEDLGACVGEQRQPQPVALELRSRGHPRARASCRRSPSGVTRPSALPTTRPRTK